jgi:hypothetical protein
VAAVPFSMFDGLGLLTLHDSDPEQSLLKPAELSG